MPYRKNIFINNGIYHIYNKTIDKKRIFADEQLCKRFIELLWFYRSDNNQIRFSSFDRLSVNYRKEIVELISIKEHFVVEILCYAIMPTHYHLLIKQKQVNGIVKFISTIGNSLTKYFNTKVERAGPLFLPRFKSRAILSDEQLMHVSRYIHTNPYSSKIIKKITNLDEYPWSSYHFFIKERNSYLVNTEPVLELFLNDKKRYQKFVENHADHQKTLEICKYSGNKWPS